MNPASAVTQNDRNCSFHKARIETISSIAIFVVFLVKYACIICIWNNSEVICWDYNTYHGSSRRQYASAPMASSMQSSRNFNTVSLVFTQSSIDRTRHRFQVLSRSSVHFVFYKFEIGMAILSRVDNLLNGKRNITLKSLSSV